MILRRVAAASPCIFASACNQELSKSDAELIDAMMFVEGGLEEGAASDADGILRMERNVVEKQVEYRFRAANPFFRSDDDPFAGSKFSGRKFFDSHVRGRLMAPCIFKISNTTFGSRGEAMKDFEDLGTTHTDINLNRMTRFEVAYGDVDKPKFAIAIEGPSVVCHSGDLSNPRCYDTTFFPTGVVSKPANQQQSALKRFERAIEFIKKTCLGKPY